jgi:o-succinylbenzoate synthase
VNIIELKYFIYKAHLPAPIKTSKLLITDKSGIIVRLKNNEGRYGYGEASPLPNFSRENIKEIIEIVQRIEARLKFDEYIDDTNLLRFTNNYASLNFGFEQAIYSLNTPAEYNSILLNYIPLNFLIGLRPDNEVLASVENAVENGYKTIKLKIGERSFTEDLSLIKKIRGKFKDILLRVDVNGAWNIKTAINNIRMLNPLEIQYIEQPVNGLNELLSVAEKVETPLAPDESISSLSDAEFAINSGLIDYIVIKPMNIGFNDSLKIIELANKNGKSVIVSSMFESPIGKNALFYLAAKTKHNYAHGLSINVKMEQNLLEQEAIISEGTIAYNGKLYPYPHSIDQLFE